MDDWKDPALWEVVTFARFEDADYEGHSLSMLRRIAEALNQSSEVRFVPNRAA